MAGNSVGSMTANAYLIVETSNLDTLNLKLNSHFLKKIVDKASKNIEKFIFIKFKNI